MAESEGLSKDANAAASINELKATDAQLTQAIATLDAEVAAQQAAVDAAQQALEAADQAVANAEQSMGGTQAHIDELKTAAAERAVEEYMRPHDDTLSHVLSADGFADASRRTALLQEVTDRDHDALADLRAAKNELQRQQKEGLDARKTASDRKTAEQAKLDQLKAAREEKAKLDKSLQDRIATYAAEDDASSARSAAATSDSGRANRGGGNEDDSRVSAAGMLWPVHGSHQINSPFGKRWGRMHQGVDIQATSGTPIYAAKAGTVTFAGWESGYGNYTCIDHGGSFSTCYGHQSRIMVKVGQRVDANEQIGQAGNTGTSAGAHLHFETCTNGVPECFFGQYKNPESYLP